MDKPTNRMAAACPCCNGTRLTWLSFFEEAFERWHCTCGATGRANPDSQELEEVPLTTLKKSDIELQHILNELRVLRAEVAALSVSTEATAAATRSTELVLQAALTSVADSPKSLLVAPLFPDEGQSAPDSRPAD